MRELVCGEHHVHDASCFSDREQLERDIRAWCKSQCELGWPRSGSEKAPKQHRPIKIEDEWRYCPLCGRQVR